jgi:hypothetical protein
LPWLLSYHGFVRTSQARFQGNANCLHFGKMMIAYLKVAAVGLLGFSIFPWLPATSRGAGALVSGPAPGLYRLFAPQQEGTPGNRQLTVKISDYCPPPDGSTDDTACIQKAIDHLHSAGGGSLQLAKSRSCYVVNPVMVYSHITLYSTDRATCVQRIGGPASGTSSVFYSDVATPIDDVHFRNFTIDGNRDHVTGPIGGTIGIALFGPSDSSIEKMTVKNAYVDGIYIDCAGPGRLTPGDGMTISQTLVTNSQRNNISVICGKNVHIEDSELSSAEGSSPEAGVDVEENSKGQQVSGFSIVRTKVHHNHKEGILVIPAFDSADSLVVKIEDDDVHDNGSYGLRAVDFTHSNRIELKGGRYVNNTGAGILLSGWRMSHVAGEIAYGSNVGLSISNNVPDSSVGPSFLSGSIYDLEVLGPFSNAIMSGVILDHGAIGGKAHVTGYNSTPVARTGKCVPNRLTSKTVLQGCASGLLSTSNAKIKESNALGNLAKDGFTRTRSLQQSKGH